MLRRLALLVAGLALALAPALALVSSPRFVPGSVFLRARSIAAAARPAGIGVPALVVGNDGRPFSQVTVTAIQDPFLDYSSVSAPDRGFHQVMVAIVVRNLTSVAIDSSAYGFAVVDRDGFVAPAASIQRTDDTASLRDFTGGPIPPGAALSGVIFAQLLNGTTPAFVDYRPASDRLVTVADLRPSPVAVGDAVAVSTNDDSALASVGVTRLWDPLPDVVAPAPRGYRYLGVLVRVTNTGAHPLTLGLESIALVDTEGFWTTPVSATRSGDALAESPDFPYQRSLGPDTATTGVVIFLVLDRAIPDIVLYQPTSASVSERRIRIADGVAGSPWRAATSGQAAAERAARPAESTIGRLVPGGRAVYAADAAPFGRIPGPSHASIQRARVIPLRDRLRRK